jgi:hypothetical protein
MRVTDGMYDAVRELVQENPDLLRCSSGWALR